MVVRKGYHLVELSVVLRVAQMVEWKVDLMAHKKVEYWVVK